MAYGEYIDPTLVPTSITVFDGTKTLTFNATNSRKNDFPGTDGLGRVRYYVVEAGVKAADLNVPVLNGNVTVTVTAVAGTKVHYRVGPKNPTWKADTNTSGDFVNLNKLVSHTLRYNSAFTINQPKPGASVTVLRLRAYKDAPTTSGEQYKHTGYIMPNWKSPLIVIRFNHNDPL
jgi:hypothetical protein